MIRAVIIDDEQHCIDQLQRILAERCAQDVAIVGDAGSVETGIVVLRASAPDLVFLDVQLGDRTGFELLEMFGKVPFEIIFTTAYERFAVRAFKVSAVDFLLKPIDGDELEQAIGKVKLKRHRDDLALRLEVLIHNVRAWEGSAKRICVPTLTGFVYLHLGDIVRCAAEANYTVIFLKEGKKLTVAKTLKDFEEMLEDYNFFRVHNSHLINLAYVKEYKRGKGGFVKMVDNAEVEVAERRRSAFLQRLTAG